MMVEPSWLARPSSLRPPTVGRRWLMGVIASRTLYLEHELAGRAAVTSPQGFDPSSSY